MRRLVIWALLVWTAVVVGGAVAGAIWGLTGFNCSNGGPGRIVMDGPCPISPDPTISESASHAAAGAITLGLGAMAIGFVPAVGFAISAGALGWILRRLGMIRAARWAPWTLLAIGAGSSAVLLILSEFVTALWAWLGLMVPIGLTAIGIERADRPGSADLEE